ncbi:hypothetical protein MPTK1_Vg01140 [Marchantia polymorpha subsp. ruderalis]|uniref:Uncharacterized protein n=1 Tax=Marchantia polymorpha TaxID=3197 RepID=A0A2R6VWY9_MARPO|nr:hypothetical protein MARPO_YA0008 [Marchantia polymorpha]BBN20656.1 hypothetical protein Mp_Vg01140 [Marchantia polymorpha subsp. ruderalis]|eukprot:PTQ26119.1 hypothetical protein MARPO_YA0008 [Marchantia polymorpha]
MKSVLLSKEVLELYQRGEEKLRRDLKLQAVEDHNWSLRSWDQDEAAVVKLYCGECRSLVGGNSGKASMTRTLSQTCFVIFGRVT